MRGNKISDVFVTNMCVAATIFDTGIKGPGYTRSAEGQRRLAVHGTLQCVRLRAPRSAMLFGSLRSIDSFWSLRHRDLSAKRLEKAVLAGRTMMRAASSDGLSPEELALLLGGIIFGRSQYKNWYREEGFTF
jgi:hypothetical protein